MPSVTAAVLIFTFFIVIIRSILGKKVFQSDWLYKEIKPVRSISV